jgi:hypothetical protein
MANDGKALVVVDVAALAHKPMPASPAGDRPIAAMPKARVEAGLAKVEASVAGYRADFERETGAGRSAYDGAVAGDGRYACSPGSGGPGWRRISGLASEAVVTSARAVRRKS